MLVSPQIMTSSFNWFNLLALDSLSPYLWDGVDLFCGAGGTTTGIVESKKARIVAAINHDKTAIASHAANHPETKHYEEDIVLFDVDKLPRKVNFIWMSAECTNLSNAKGGESRDADSRTLSEQIYRYADHCNPDYIFVENVREILQNSPLIPKTNKAGEIIYKKGKPVMVPDRSPEKLGLYYHQWVDTLRKMGYDYRYKLLNSADYGAYTSRLRYFAVFAKKGLPIRFPSPTHHKTGANGLATWKAVKEVLDFSDEGNSIFNRPKPLSEKTLARILAGLTKYVAQGDKAFITKWMGNDAKTGINSGKSIHEPSPVLTTQNRLGLVSPSFMLNYGKKGLAPLDMPAGTITTRDRMALLNVDTESADVELPTNGPELKLIGPSASELLRFAESAPETASIGKYFIHKYYNGLENLSSVEEPAGTLTCTPKLSLVKAEHFIVKYYSGKPEGKVSSVESPCSTIKCKDSNAIVSISGSKTQQELTPWLMNAQYNNVGQLLSRPHPTIVASKHQTYLVRSMAGMAVKFKEADTFYMRKIKEFCQLYQISDVKMRMLKISEQKLIQGFPSDYILKGTQTHQKKGIGNSVVPIMAKRLIEENYDAYMEKFADLQLPVAV